MQRNLGGPLNFLTHLIIEMMSWLPLRSIINQWRREQLGLPPASVNYPQQRRRQKAPMLFGFSPHVVPKPADWGDHIHVTGYWFLDQSADWQPPADLLDFLAAGPPPVFVGFGSMPSGNAEEMTDLVLQALARTKQRGLISTGGGDLSLADLPDHVFKVGIIPYEWLFPQMAAVVHHGGSGTTAISLQAGIPSIILPFFMDQPFWGQRVADLGVGPQPIPRKYLSIERLAAAITVATTDPEMQCRAIMLGEHIRAEDGVARAVEVLNRYLLSP
jgi:sterol 3beta-glucosyltransferase